MVVAEDQHVAYDVDVLYGIPSFQASLTPARDVEYNRCLGDSLLPGAGVNVYYNLYNTRRAFIRIKYMDKERG